MYEALCFMRIAVTVFLNLANNKKTNITSPKSNRYLINYPSICRGEVVSRQIHKKSSRFGKNQATLLMHMYRVAQNKISHRTKCTFSTTV